MGGKLGELGERKRYWSRVVVWNSMLLPRKTGDSTHKELSTFELTE